ncbi:hypothetical protein GOY07_03335 [Wolbachia endosymbiont of Litomosoides sigmodontis]|uniref:hypothetical protein n=1 Tax=Wolbachia endosymbiont of Litomosoides sigmodontis TaxID=80850 RepID=UPI00158A88F3|nr:hypothetical protein [Wolbachia endosymbiont of Litomosoides sigmodontis]QKX03187.1 hypothetical protein GOY07_03335 [Wolbachia endosymbiont of Litomosoides sigmodontis]
MDDNTITFGNNVSTQTTKTVTLCSGVVVQEEIITLGNNFSVQATLITLDSESGHMDQNVNFLGASDTNSLPLLIFYSRTAFIFSAKSK